MAKKKKGPASAKRRKMSQAQQMMLLSVMTASVILGVCLVLAINGVKYIGFYKEVIIEKDKAIGQYAKTLVNTGACRSQKGELTDEELKQCNPNTTSADTVVGTLKYNVMDGVANNADLEAVETQSAAFSFCYNKKGEKRDYSAEYYSTENEGEREKLFSLFKACSALRIVPDALPAQANEEALMASLNQIFNISEWEPESISPSQGGNNNDTSAYAGIGILPVNFTVESDSKITMGVLNNLERSIRTFDIRTATIEWSGDTKLNMRVNAWAYYTDPTVAQEKSVTVSAKKNNKGSTATGTGISQ